MKKSHPLVSMFRYSLVTFACELLVTSLLVDNNLTQPVAL